MVKNLSLGDLELILCDWYEMDEQLPNPIFEKKEFERVSNGLLGNFEIMYQNRFIQKLKLR